MRVIMTLDTFMDRYYGSYFELFVRLSGGEERFDYDNSDSFADFDPDRPWVIAFLDPFTGLVIEVLE